MIAAVLISCFALASAMGGYEINHPQPYKFGYSVKDKHGEQHREESGNGAGGVVGSYGFTDDRGIARKVNYVADKAGFRAQVKTNEPGTANQNPAAVQIIDDPYARGAAEPFLSRPTGAAVAPAVFAGAGYGGYGLGYNGLRYGEYGLGYNGLGYGGYGLGYNGRGNRGYGLGYNGRRNGGYGLGYNGLGNGGYGLGYNGNALGYSGLLGGYGGVVNYGAPLVGGAIRGYDSRFARLSL